MVLKITCVRCNTHTHTHIFKTHPLSANNNLVWNLIQANGYVEMLHFTQCARYIWMILAFNLHFGRDDDDTYTQHISFLMHPVRNFNAIPSQFKTRLKHRKHFHRYKRNIMDWLTVGAKTINSMEIRSINKWTNFDRPIEMRLPLRKFLHLSHIIIMIGCTSVRLCENNSLKSMGPTN